MRHDLAPAYIRARRQRPPHYQPEKSDHLPHAFSRQVAIVQTPCQIHAQRGNSDECLIKLPAFSHS
jgi:hypothetical protein